MSGRPPAPLRRKDRRPSLHRHLPEPGRRRLPEPGRRRLPEPGRQRLPEPGRQRLPEPGRRRRRYGHCRRHGLQMLRRPCRPDRSGPPLRGPPPFPPCPGRCSPGCPPEGGWYPGTRQRPRASSARSPRPSVPGAPSGSAGRGAACR
ncbi:MAG: hypothetical protein LBQ79_00710 [Deltaproteobacteria bacterium]|nr:hypothetical protein [Deltaproteobacteria bacterium]